MWRYFINAVPKGKQYDYSQPAVQGVQYCNWLFVIEDSINKKHPSDYEKRKQLRLEKKKPVLEAFWSWIDQQKPVRNIWMDKSVNYVLNRRDTAEIYLEDGSAALPIISSRM
ncbi:IS66 family transposase [Mediterraneibacter gnavus]|uniref:IS66 family transposase n=1 Tax=Mediterraneibacter gnavus TaxID=33038 RepID=UPI003A148693